MGVFESDKSSNLLSIIEEYNNKILEEKKQIYKFDFRTCQPLDDVTENKTFNPIPKESEICSELDENASHHLIKKMYEKKFPGSNNLKEKLKIQFRKSKAFK